MKNYSEKTVLEYIDHNIGEATKFLDTTAFILYRSWFLRDLIFELRDNRMSEFVTLSIKKIDWPLMRSYMERKLSD